VVAKSFARIHRRNLIAQSVLPLEFADEADFDRLQQGEILTVEGVRSGVVRGDTTFDAVTGQGDEMRVVAHLSSGERDALLAGGTIKLLKGGGTDVRGRSGRMSAGRGGREPTHRPVAARQD
jgi:aconitate hydratase